MLKGSASLSKSPLGHLAWVQCILYFAIAAAWLLATNFPFDQRAILDFLSCSGLGLAIWLIYHKFRPNESLAAFGLSFAQLGITVFAGTIVSYVALRLGFPYQDEWLARADLWLGFDWEAFVRWFDTMPASAIMKYAYASLHPQLIALLFVLSFLDRAEAMRKFMGAFFLSLSIALLVSVFVPARAYYAYLQIHDGQFAHYLTPSYVDYMAMLRSELAAKAFKLTGVVTFPSFHASAAILFMWGFWNVPYARSFALALNVIMLVSTIVVGGHYFVDIIGGVLAALLSIYAVEKIGKYESGAIKTTTPFPAAPAEIYKIAR